jgi:hypothetical protein
LPSRSRRLGQAFDHGGDHLRALVLGELLRGRHVLRRRPARRDPWPAPERRRDTSAMRCSRLERQGASAGAAARIALYSVQRVVELAVLLAGQRQPEAAPRAGRAGVLRIFW